MKAVLTKNSIVLGSDIYLAENLLTRLKGLIGKQHLSPGQGLLIRPCKGIHTFFMRFPIDVVFLDKKNIVIACIRKLPPNRISAIYRKAHSVLELPPGTLDSATEIGDRIEFT